MVQHVGKIQAAALLGVGAAFDFVAGDKAPGAVMDAAFRFGVAIPSHNGASAAGSPLSRLQLDFCRSRVATACRMEILRSRLVNFARCISE